MQEGLSVLRSKIPHSSWNGLSLNIQDYTSNFSLNDEGRNIHICISTYNEDMHSFDQNREKCEKIDDVNRHFTISIRASYV